MAFNLRSKVIDLSTTTGTGTYTLVETPVEIDGVTYEVFADFLADGDTTYYHASMGDDWEEGVGTYDTDGTLARSQIFASTNSGSAVDWGAGTKRIVCGLPAQRAQGWEFIERRVVTGTNFTDITGIDKFAKVRISGFIQVGTSGANLAMLLKNSGGWVNSSNAYYTHFLYGAGAGAGASGALGTNIPLMSSLYSGAGEHFDFNLEIVAPGSSSRFTSVFGTYGAVNSSPTYQNGILRGTRLVSEVNDGIEFFVSTGNFADSEFLIEGWRG